MKYKHYIIILLLIIGAQAWIESSTGMDYKHAIKYKILSILGKE